MELVYPLATDARPELAQVGGKAMSLILMSRRGLPVPPGFVLTVAFFEPWLEYIRGTFEWAEVLNGPSKDLEGNCEAVKALCRELQLDAERRTALSRALEPLKTHGEVPLFAVRSSSPEEDLEELSFAGGYETVLGVREHGLEEAIRRSFASCFDDRVFLYKQEHGLAVDQTRIAVIVQQQIAAETAGVAFSLNPLNNCYDEAVINANYGLGESVVAGLVSPDSFVVDKIARTILERKVGKKETSIWLTPDGGTSQRPSASREQLCLSDVQVLALADAVDQVEAFYGKPMDVEWAFANGDLYLLQARPITACFPLPEAMLTAPGAPKRLYGDLTLVKWGMHEPLSVMGTDYLAIMNSETLKASMGDIGPDVINQVRLTLEGRTYVNVSYTLKIRGKKGLVGFWRPMDTLGAETIASIDETEYTLKKLPRALRGLVFKMIRQNLGLIGGMLQALRKPTEFKHRYFDEEALMRAELKRIEGEEQLCLAEHATRTMRRMISYAGVFGSGMAAAELARSRISKLFRDEKPEIRDQVVYLGRALPNNITIEMGLAMYSLAGLQEISTCASGKDLAAGLEERSFSPEFLDAWDAFMETYGFRGPMEMDVAAPRFYEQPALFFEQLRALAENRDAEHNPQAIFDRARAQREQAYQNLLRAARKKGKRRAKRFEKYYRILVELGGLRERPKYFVSLLTDMFRRKVLAAAQPLLDAGRLDHPEQVFDLTMDDLERGLDNPSVDLRALAEKNTRFRKRLQRVRELPRIVDSRGKILQPPRKEAGEGELLGEPLSPGIVRGRIKVLHEPDEKLVLPGEILVARTTDPGWTPLFLNAGGIILEIGGLLQHGALVAREYGKPCVSGIEDATETLKDGQVVELDGTNGVVRLTEYRPV